jgi:hypothetical protein
MIDIDFDKYFKAGEIIKPEFDTIKNKLNRVIEKEFDDINQRNWEVSVHNFTTLRSFHPSLFTLPRMKRVLPPRNKDIPYTIEVLNFYEKWIPVAEDYKKLKLIVKKTTVKRAEVKKSKEIEFARKCHVDPLVQTLMQHHDAFIKGARRAAGEMYDENLAYLKENGGLEKVAPLPTFTEFNIKRTIMTTSGQRTITSYDKEGFERAKRKHEFYKDFIMTSRESYIEDNEEYAHEVFMSWIKKMAAKIKKIVIEADMNDNGDPWGNSVLKVTTEDGEHQVWHTKMIINRSKYAKLFHQFPTRRMK